MSWYFAVLKKYAVFAGRARRTEYWMFVLFNMIIGFVLGFLMALESTLSVLYFLYLLGIIVPSIAVCVRRLHDTNRSGWWFLVSFIPLIGAIVLIVFLVQDSTPGQNQYGPNPKGA